MESNGERLIHDYIHRRGFKHRTQHTDWRCYYIKVLRFDFAIYKENSYNLLYLIEFDGEQHFEPRFGNYEDFKQTVKRDKIKNSFCKRHEIPLLRIPYTEIKNIDFMLWAFHLHTTKYGLSRKFNPKVILKEELKFLKEVVRDDSLMYFDMHDTYGVPVFFSVKWKIRLLKVNREEHLQYKTPNYKYTLLYISTRHSLYTKKDIFDNVEYEGLDVFDILLFFNKVRR